MVKTDGKAAAKAEKVSQASDKKVDDGKLKALGHYEIGRASCRERV